MNFATSNEWFFTTSEFLQRATSATSSERILKRVTSGFLKRATSTTKNGWIFATSNEQILQQLTSDFTPSNEQRVNFNK